MQDDAQPSPRPAQRPRNGRRCRHIAAPRVAPPSTKPVHPHKRPAPLQASTSEAHAARQLTGPPPRPKRRLPRASAHTPRRRSCARPAHQTLRSPSHHDSRSAATTTTEHAAEKHRRGRRPQPAADTSPSTDQVCSRSPRCERPSCECRAHATRNDRGQEATPRHPQRRQTWEVASERAAHDHVRHTLGTSTRNASCDRRRGAPPCSTQDPPIASARVVWPTLPATLQSETLPDAARATWPTPPATPENMT